MGAKTTYTAEQFIKAIKGSGGIISAIADKVGCDWHTAKRWITDYSTVRRAYDDEREFVTDMAESVLLTSIKAGDSADAKWWLSRIGAGRGFADKKEISGPDGGPIYVVNWESHADTDDDSD